MKTNHHAVFIVLLNGLFMAVAAQAWSMVSGSALERGDLRSSFVFGMIVGIASVMPEREKK